MSNCLFFILSMDLHWLGLCLESIVRKSLRWLRSAIFRVPQVNAVVGRARESQMKEKILYASPKQASLQRLAWIKQSFVVLRSSSLVNIHRRFVVALLCRKFRPGNTKDKKCIWWIKKKFGQLCFLSYDVMSSGTQLPTFRRSLVSSDCRQTKNFSRQHDQC